MTRERRRFFASSTCTSESTCPESKSRRQAIPSSLREKTEYIPGVSMILVPSGGRENTPWCSLPTGTSTPAPGSERVQRPARAQI